MVMEITINIKLENGDIALLIKSLFEIIKKIPQDTINIVIDPNAVPLQSKPEVVPLTTPSGTATDPNYIPPLNTTTDPNINHNQDVYYSNNGKSVKKIESEKKNEVV